MILISMQVRNRLSKIVHGWSGWKQSTLFYFEKPYQSKILESEWCNNKFRVAYAHDAWTIWNLNREISFPGILLLEGNLCNFEGKYIIYMNISVFFLQQILKMCKKVKFVIHFLNIFQTFAFSPQPSVCQ